ncbi:MAG: radical SAM protein [Clostridia bacterium]|nr:radical SAM protein [Clostridia bacterium]
MFALVYADEKGCVFDYPSMGLVGRSGRVFVEPVAEEMIPLPPGATLTLVPDSVPLGLMPDGQFTKLSGNPNGAGRVFAVGALLPQGYTRTLLPAYLRPGNQGWLPLLGYAAVGFHKGGFYVAAMATDDPHKWDPNNFNTVDLPALVEKRLAQHPHNRILQQLAKCSLDYGCLTAQNVFYRRWEGGLPVSPHCNARCLGCISQQPAECCPSPQTRIGFQPRLEEVLDVAVPHLKEAPEAIVSFGQGCEGEPSLAASLISEAIKKVRQATSRGTININTNAGYTEGIAAICAAGLDAMRVSIISPTEKIYDAYYRPQGYRLEDVRKSIVIAKNHGVLVSLNLLTLPGLNDREDETEALLELVRSTGVDRIQIRNLNIDPDQLQEVLGLPEEESLGILRFIEVLRQELPGVEIGNYSRPAGGE